MPSASNSWNKVTLRRCAYVRVTNVKVDFDLFVKTFKEFPPR